MKIKMKKIIAITILMVLVISLTGCNLAARQIDGNVSSSGMVAQAQTVVTSGSFAPTKLTSYANGQLIQVYLPNPNALEKPKETKHKPDFLPQKQAQKDSGSIAEIGYNYTLNNYLYKSNFGNLSLDNVGEQTTVLTFCDAPSRSGAVAGVFNIDTTNLNFNPKNGDTVKLEGEPASKGAMGIITKENGEFSIQMVTEGSGYKVGEKVQLYDITRNLVIRGTGYVMCGFAALPETVRANSTFTEVAYLVICNTGLYPINSIGISDLVCPNVVDAKLEVNVKHKFPIEPNGYAFLEFTLSGKAPLQEVAVDLGQVSCTLVVN